jgi:hypothetical protein
MLSNTWPRSTLMSCLAASSSQYWPTCGLKVAAKLIHERPFEQHEFLLRLDFLLCGCKQLAVLAHLQCESCSTSRWTSHMLSSVGYNSSSSGARLRHELGLCRLT